MTVLELRSLLEALPDEAEVRIVSMSAPTQHEVGAVLPRIKEYEDHDQVDCIVYLTEGDPTGDAPYVPEPVAAQPRRDT